MMKTKLDLDNFGIPIRGEVRIQAPIPSYKFKIEFSLSEWLNNAVVNISCDFIGKTLLVSIRDTNRDRFFEEVKNIGQQKQIVWTLFDCDDTAIRSHTFEHFTVEKMIVAQEYSSSDPVKYQLHLTYKTVLTTFEPKK